MLPCLIRKFGMPWYLLFLHLSNGFVIEPEARYMMKLMYICTTILILLDIFHGVRLSVRAFIT